MTEDSQSTVPPRTDPSQPNAARMYDYYLGGASNFEADRAAAEALLAKIPEARAGARFNRAFLARAVRALRADGVRQFIDLGSGIPTVGNVHEVAQADDPTVRVAYVDREIVAVSHGRRMLEGNPTATVTHADLRDVDTVLSSPEVAGLIDFEQPVAFLFVAVLHFLPDDEPARALARYRDACVAGGYLVLSHASLDHLDGRETRASELLNTYRATETPFVPRTYAETAALLDGLELLEPGLVHAAAWRPDSPVEDPRKSGFYAAVAVVPPVD